MVCLVCLYVYLNIHIDKYTKTERQIHKKSQQIYAFPNVACPKIQDRIFSPTIKRLQQYPQRVKCSKTQKQVGKNTKTHKQVDKTQTNTQQHINRLTKTHKHLDTYTRTVGQIHKNIWTNTHKHSDKYT